jgi:hypothetical protein
MEHKRRTKSLLQTVQRREVVVLCLFTVADEYASGSISTLELQRKAIRLLHSLQKLSLTIVEHIDRWREQLTRPYPFMFQKTNYLMKMIADNHLISSSALNQVLPLRLYDYPLCSHLPSLAMLTAEMQESGFVTYPLQPGKKGYFRALSGKYQARLKRAEAYMKNELKQQQTLVNELQTLAENDLFLPILNTPIITGCVTGINLKSSVWGSRLHQALSDASTSLTTMQYKSHVLPQSISGLERSKQTASPDQPCD